MLSFCIRCKDAYRALPLPPLCSADDHIILLDPAYTPVISMAKRVVTTIKQWTVESIHTLQGCFKSTDWDSLLSPSDNINEQVYTVTSYNSFCVDNIIPSKTVTILPNNRPCITKELKDEPEQEEDFLHWLRTGKNRSQQRGQADI